MSDHQKDLPQSIHKQQNPHVSPEFACNERLDANSPVAFKEPLYGSWNLHKEYLSTKTKEEKERQGSRFRTELDTEDVKLVNELGHLSADKLMEYVRTLQNTSLSLGEEEAAQFTRAKLLKILEK